jgi:hypothetical protein
VVDEIVLGPAFSDLDAVPLSMHHSYTPAPTIGPRRICRAAVPSPTRHRPSSMM